MVVERIENVMIELRERFQKYNKEHNINANKITAN